VKQLLWMLLPAVALCVVAGCKTYPNGPTAPTSVSVSGNYVGAGTLDGGTSNIFLTISGPDSLEHFAGQINYRSQAIDLSSVTEDSTGDTIRFQYPRDNVQHVAWALADASGLSVHYTAPTGIAAIRLNREIGGYNMSGIWQGTMFSNGLLAQRAASLTMDQEGSIYYGTLDVNLGQSAHVQFSSGGYNANSFQVAGTMRYGTTDYPFTAAGSYVSRDSISGNWTAGDFGSLDHGTFDFRRSFQ
jgi:hypothetical protein